MFFFGCEEEDNTATGYNCVDNDCFSEEGGQYATLDDCLSVCNNNSTMRYNCEPAYGCIQIETFGEYDSLEECEDVCSQCNCGEVVDIDYYPAFAGNYVVDVNDLDGDGEIDDIIVVGDHPDYSFTIFQMYCSGEMMSLCGDELEVGELFCFDYMADCYIAECAWGPMTYFDVDIDNWVTEDMYLESISISDGVFTLSGLGPIQTSQTSSFDCD